MTLGNLAHWQKRFQNLLQNLPVETGHLMNPWYQSYMELLTFSQYNANNQVWNAKPNIHFPPEMQIYFYGKQSNIKNLHQKPIFR